MYKNNTISVVLTAYDEEKQIVKTIKNLPDFVDKIIVVNDASKDKTLEIVEQEMKSNDKLFLINHEKNQGVGGAVSSGIKWSRDNDID
ncbi:MAG: glycosyltransferase, partial [Nitrosopumilus sp.]